MLRVDELKSVLYDLIGLMHCQANELEKLANSVEKHAGPLSATLQFGALAAGLNALNQRVKDLDKP